MRFVYLLLLLCGVGICQPMVTLAQPTYVYITIDDGPISGTKRLVDIAEKYRVRLSMLLVGKQVQHSTLHQEWLDLAKKSAFVFLGNHSFSHAHGRYHAFYLKPKDVLEDFQKNKHLLALKTNAARLPGRNMWVVDGRHKYDIANGISSAQLLAANGYQVFGWDLEWAHDGKTGEPIQSVDNILNEIELAKEHAFTKGHVVLLTHDEMFKTKTDGGELIELIQKLQQKGYVLRALDRYGQP